MWGEGREESSLNPAFGPGIQVGLLFKREIWAGDRNVWSHQHMTGQE